MPAPRSPPPRDPHVHGRAVWIFFQNSHEQRLQHSRSMLELHSRGLQGLARLHVRSAGGEGGGAFDASHCAGPATLEEAREKYITGYSKLQYDPDTVQRSIDRFRLKTYGPPLRAPPSNRPPSLCTDMSCLCQYTQRTLFGLRVCFKKHKSVGGYNFAMYHTILQSLFGACQSPTRWCSGAFESCIMKGAGTRCSLRHHWHT